MHQKFTRWSTVAALAIVGAVPLVVHSARAQSRVPDPIEGPAGDARQSVASVDQLKTEAFRALRVGNFRAGDDLLARAAKQSNDPQLGQMHQWTETFEGQLKRFTDERHTAYDKAFADVQTMLKGGHEDAALDLANRAQLLSDDKDEFHNLPWMRSLIADSVKRAAGYERSDQWLQAMRVYEDLAAVEPASRDWKEHLKAVTRRVRLLASYAPDAYRDLLDKYLAERDAVDALLTTVSSTTRPTTGPTAAVTHGPTTQPLALAATTKPSAAELLANSDVFRTDWHDTLRGVTRPQLAKAIDDVYQNYYRDVTYRGLLAGGLDQLTAVLNTRGLETAFPGLADPAKRAAFQAFLDGWRALAAHRHGRQRAGPDGPVPLGRRQGRHAGRQRPHGGPARPGADQRVRRGGPGHAGPVHEHDLAERPWPSSARHPGRVQRRRHPDRAAGRHRRPEGGRAPARQPGRGGRRGRATT